MPRGVSAGDGSGEGKFFQIVYDSTSLAEEAMLWMRERLTKLVDTAGVPVRDIDRTVRHLLHVLVELGSDALCFSLSDSIVPQLETAAAQCAMYGGRSSLTSKMLEEMRRKLGLAATDLAADPYLTDIAPKTSTKALRLVYLITELFDRHSTDEGYRGIVFVEQVALTTPLAHLLNKCLSAAQRGGCDVRSVSGQTSDKQVKAEMDSLHGLRTRLLVCTSMLEEGIDVADCAFVVRFNVFNTTKSHIQGSGRARRHDAEVYYFDNDIAVEKEKHRQLTAVARDSSLSLTNTQMDLWRDFEMRSVPGIYPYHPGDSRGPAFGGTVVNLSNCLNIVYVYCAKIMKHLSFNPENIYVINDAGGIAAVSLPSPEGFILVSQADAAALWGPTRIEDITGQERFARLSKEDVERRRILYVAAIRLHSLALLGPDNQPTREALEACTVCTGFPYPIGVRLRDRYGEDARRACFPAESFGWNAGLSMPVSHAPQHNTVVPDSSRALHAPPRSQNHSLTGSFFAATGALPSMLPSTPRIYEPVFASPSDPSSGGALTGRNFKGQLNEWALARWRCSTPELLRYSCRSGATGGFIVSVELLKTGKCFQSGQPRATKKEAEQDAARAALEGLR